jgi:hypothetical protein
LPISPRGKKSTPGLGYKEEAGKASHASADARKPKRCSVSALFSAELSQSLW